MGKAASLSARRRLTNPPLLFPRRVLAMTISLLMGLGTLAATAVHASPAAATLGTADVAGIPVTPSIRDDRQYVFSIGMLARVTDGTITLRFDDGHMQTYRVGAATTIHTPTGAVEHLDDLAVGDMVLVITEEHQATAVTVVTSGGPDFAESGPYDIGDGE